MNQAFRKVAGAWLAAALFSVPTQAQETTSDAAWKTRLAALQEEHDAQAGVAVSIVFDDSGSMNDNNKLSMAKQAFRAWIEHANDSYRFGLRAINAGELVKLQRNDRAQLLAAVQKLRASGTTPLADTIARAADEIRRRRAAGALYERQVVVVLTDGEDNSKRGIPGVQEEMNRLRQESVEVVAFGYQGEGEYMRDCATHFFSPNNGQDISRGLDAIAAEVNDTSDVVIDDATRRLMGALPGVASMQSAPVIEPTVAAATTSAPPAAATTSRKRHPFLLWLGVFVGVMLIRSALGNKRR